MATEDTLGYAALQQMLSRQNERRQDDRLRQQNNLQDERENRKTTDGVFMDIYKTQELEKTKQAAADHALELERSRSADRNLALKIHDDNTDLAREQQKALADAARLQRADQEKGRRSDKQSGLFARYLSMKNGDSSPMFSPEEAWRAASYHASQEPDEVQAQGQPAQPPLTQQAVPQGAPPAGAPPGPGTPPGAPAGGPTVAGPAVQRQTTPFATGSERKEANQDIRGSVAHYATGQSILQDLQAVPDNMFGAGKSMVRAARANTGEQTPQDQQERRIETNINSKMQMWLSDLLLTKSGKTVTEGEFIRIAKAVGMAPDWIERSASAFGKAAAVLGGAVTGGPVGAFAGANAAESAINGIVGQMSSSILNKPNKQEAVQGLQDYLENHKANTRIRAGQYKMEDPFPGEGSAPFSVPAAPVSDRLQAMRDIIKKHSATKGPAKPAAAAPATGNDDERNHILDDED